MGRANVLLVKFSTKKYKILTLAGLSIRIGTLKYYRNIENKLIRDEEEGGGRIVYDCRIPLTAERFNRYFVDDNIKLAEGWSFNTSGVPLVSERSPFNAFIFCCTLVNDEKEIPKLSQAFKSNAHYYIKDIWEFADRIGDRLLKRVIREARRYPERISFSADQLSSLKVYPMVGKVKYSDEPKVRAINENNLDTFNPRLYKPEHLITKPLKFASEQEFRFIWFLNLGDVSEGKRDLVSIEYNHFDIKFARRGLSWRPTNLSREDFKDKHGNLFDLT